MLPLIVAIALVIAAAALVPQRWPRRVDTQQFGALQVYPAWLRQNGMVYVFSGADGWSPADEQAARRFARAGNFVAGIDTPRLLEHINHLAPGCVFVPGMLEDYSHQQQRAAGTTQFAEPALMGRGIGAALVYMAQVQAPPLAFHAAVMLDAQPKLALAPPLCDHPAAQRDASGQTLRPEALGPNVPARLWVDQHASPQAQAFATAIAAASRAPGTAAADADSLSALYRAGLRDIDADLRRGGVADLPLVEVAAAHPDSNFFAILYSGDGGWRDLDRTLAGVLAEKGVNVVGVDVLRYYWRRQSPEVAARDLARIVHHYQQRWQRHQVVLIGFSFGADVLPFLVSHLPDAIRADVRLLSLLSPERRTAFEVEPTGWFGVQSDSITPIEPELKKMPGIRVQCIFGTDEGADSLCTTASASTMQVIRKPGGHHFDQNYGELADAIIAAARQ